MQPSNVATVYKKELLETLRDRRTLISSILVPMLLFPVLILGISVLATLIVSRARKDNPTVMVLGSENAPELSRRLEKEKDMEVVPPAADYARRIDAKNLRAAVEFPAGVEQKARTVNTESQTVKIYWYEGEFRSEGVVRKIERVIREFNEETVKAALASRGFGPDFLKPFDVEQKNVASAERVTGNIVGMMLPYMVIILCLTGAMYPAIDLTAGEKERGTIETILASPVARSELVSGKFLLVLTVSLGTAALSLASFAITILGGATLLARISSKLVLAVSVKAMVAVFLLILPVAVLFAAALMAIALIARSYREAQTYLAPLMFVVIIPAVFSMMPGIELTPKLAMIPILNVSLVAKELFAGLYPWNYILLIFGSTAVYAGIAIYFAIRQFQREEVLFRT